MHPKCVTTSPCGSLAEEELALEPTLVTEETGDG